MAFGNTTYNSNRDMQVDLLRQEGGMPMFLPPDLEGLLRRTSSGPAMTPASGGRSGGLRSSGIRKPPDREKQTLFGVRMPGGGFMADDGSNPLAEVITRYL